MNHTYIEPRSAVPAGHKVFAVLLAIAVAGAGCAWLIYQSQRTASTALLTLHSALTGQIDPGLASAPWPAVAMADSFLTDRALEGFIGEGDLKASTSAGKIGEFRSRLRLSEPSPKTLGIRFISADPDESIAVANSIAHAIAAWNPSAVSPAPRQASSSAPLLQGQSTPQQPVRSAAQPQTPIADALDRLGAELSSTAHQVEAMGASGAQTSQQNSYLESKQQALMKTAVLKARQQMGDLRTQHPRRLADPRIRGRLYEIQQALASILPATRTSGRNGFAAAGVTAQGLLVEQSELRQAINIIHSESQVIRQIEGSQAAAATPPPTPSGFAAQNSTISAADSPTLQEETLPAAAPAEGGQHLPSHSPFTLTRLAVPATRPQLWPAIAAGLLCGLLYLGIVALAYRGGGSRRRYEDAGEEEPSTPPRFITPSTPVVMQEHADGPPAAIAATPPPQVETRHRAPFEWQPHPTMTGSVPADVRIGASAQPPMAARVQAGAAIPEDSSEPQPSAPAGTRPLRVVPRPAAVSNTQPAAPETDPRPMRITEGRPANPVVEAPDPAEQQAVDPVAERIRMSIAETSIGRLLEGWERDRGDKS